MSTSPNTPKRINPVDVRRQISQPGKTQSQNITGDVVPGRLAPLPPFLEPESESEKD